MRAIARMLLIGMTLVILAGCGKDDGKVTIFITDDIYDTSDIREPLEKFVQEKVGEDQKVEVIASPIYNEQKVLLEYAASKNEIMILPETIMKSYANQGAHVVLDDEFDAKKYPTGYFEAAVLDVETNETITQTHLFAIPIQDMKVFKDIKFAREGLYATIPVTSDSFEAAIKMLKVMTE
ncbi:hypothetical protein [Paenibacillus sp. CMAA1364]